MSSSKGTEKVAVESKDALVAKVSNLPYNKRIHQATLIGLDNKDSPQLKQLITELRQHGAPEAPNMSVEQEFIQILPPQKTNLAKHYNEDQLAMHAAVAAKALDVMEAELQSPSIQFKKMAIQQIVSLEKDDEKLYQYVISAVPAYRKKFIHYLIAARKTGVLERAFPVLEKEHGLDVVADFVHGCSTGFLYEQLKRRELRVCKAIHWTKIARYNGPVILEMIRRKLNIKIEKQKSNLGTVWDRWYQRLGDKVVRTELLRNGRNSALVLEIALSSPMYTYIGTARPVPKFSECPKEDMVLSLPIVITKNIAHFVRRHPKEMMDFLKRTVWIATDSYNNTKYLQGLYPDFWACTELKQLRSKGFSFLLEIVKHILATSTPATFNHDHIHRSVDILGFQQNWVKNSFLKNFSHGQLTVLLEEWMKYLDRMRPTAAAYAKWTHLPKGMTLGKCITRWTTTVRDVYSAILKEMKARERKLDLHEKTLDGDSFTTRTTTAISTRGRRVARRVATPVASGTKKRMRFKTIEQVASTKRHIASKREKHTAYRRQAFASYVDVELSPKWDFSKEKTKTKKTELDRRRIGLSYFLTLVPHIQDDVASLSLIYERMWPFWAEGQNYREAAPRYGSSWIALCRNLTTLLLATLDQLSKDQRQSEQDRAAAKTLKAKVYDRVMEHYSTDPITYVSDIVGAMQYALPEQRVKTFQLYTVDQLAHLGRIHEHQLDMLFNNVIGARVGSSDSTEGATDLTPIWLAAAKLLVDGELSEDIRDKLLSYQDVSDHAVRKSLSKTADSNSTDQRNASYETLIKATVLSKSVTQMKRTLQHFRTKLKNESASNRAAALQILVKQLSDTDPDNKKPDLVYAAECHQIWFDMLSDALESPDLKEDATILANFLELSKWAIYRSAGNTSDPLFNFGVEMQWRISRFNLGEKKNLAQFRIETPRGMRAGPGNRFFPPGTEKQFVSGVVKAYKDHIQEKSPDFLSDVTFLEPLYPIVGRQWQYIPELQDHVRQIIEEVKKNEKDKEGLYIIEKDSDIVRVFETLFNLEGGDRGEWHKIPVLTELVDILLHSRQARRVVFHYVWKHSGTKRSEKKKAREECVLKLLSITKSAIYLRFVWRFLVRYRQDLLDEFLNPGKTFRGVFYLEPDQRGPLPKDETARETWWQGLCDVDVVQQLKEEKEKEEEIEEERERWLAEHKETKAELNIEYDNEEFFCLPSCFGLKRLLPSQVAKLAQQRRNQIFNENLSLPNRVKAAQLWTIMPTVDYNDIVRFYEKHDKGTHKLAVNIIEAALKGVMQIDEPCAPLQFLLSPKFLSSDRARIATYCIAKCVPFMPSNQMTQTLIVVLTGDRRKELKVTAYKEIIRLLASRPTEKHLQMIMHEWKRDTLHRDVRIAILQRVMGFLKKDADDKLAWEILESAAASKNPEILVALLGTRPESVRTMTTPARVCMKPRLQEHFEALSKCFIPQKCGERFARDIVLKFSKSCPDEDVRCLATSILHVWREYKTLWKEFATQLYIGVTDVRPEVVNCPRVDIQVIHNNRYSAYLSGLLLVCRLHQSSTAADNAKPLYKIAIKAMNTLCQALKAVEDREMKHNLLERVRQFASSISYDAPVYYYPIEVERSLISRPLKSLDGAFWEFLVQRKVSRFGNRTPATRLVKYIGKTILPELMRHPIREDFILNILAQMYSNYSYQQYRNTAHALLDNFIDNTVTQDEGLRASFIYQNVRRKFLLRALSSYESGDYATDNRKEKLLAFFKEIGNFLGRRNLSRTGTDEETNKLITFITNAARRSVRGRGGSLSGAALSKTPKALIDYVATAAISAYEKDYVPSVEGRYYLGLALELACNHAPILVAGAKVRLCKLVDQLINHLAREPTSANVSKAQIVVTSIARAIEDRSCELGKPCGTSALARVDNQQRVPTLQFLEIFLASSLSNAHRIDLRRLGTHDEPEEGPTEFQYAPAFDNFLFEVQLAVLNNYRQFVLQKSDAFKLFLHRTLVHAASCTEDTPRLTINGLKSQLSNIITNAYRQPITLVTLAGEEDHIERLNKEYANNVTQAANHALALIKSLVALSLVSKNKAKTDAKKQGMTFLLGIYRHISLNLALDLLQGIGKATAIPKPAQEEEAKKEDEKGKEKDDAEKKDEQEEEAEEDEKKKKKKQKAKKAGKKKKAVTEMVWRAEFEEVLDQLSADKDETISSVALYVVTRFWN